MALARHAQFAFGYAVGYHFIDTPTGQMNGNFVGIGAVTPHTAPPAPPADLSAPRPPAPPAVGVLTAELGTLRMNWLCLVPPGRPATAGASLRERSGAAHPLP